jgi:hypothetical protein
MMAGKNPESWNLFDLRQRCAEESQLFYQGKDHDPRFCFELFRRAIRDQDQQAWEYVYQQYRPLVAGWVEKHTLFSKLSEEKEYFVNRTYEKMWKSLTPDKFLRFSALKALLHYLKMCVASVMIDHARGQEWHAIAEPVETGVNEAFSEGFEGNSLEDMTIQRIQANELWEKIKELTTNRREYCVMAGSFILGLKPREVYETYGGEFKDIQDVYRVKENVIERLRRNQGFLDYFSAYAGKKA